ncbi:MAG: LysR family transcriptional regulator [Sandaracinaceae bacterium]|nr:LysR family transcriptional regulator [Sandaracinaceae bacterium]
MDRFEPFTLDQMTVFLAVVEHGGFSAAARELGRVQSAVSHSVASLEVTLSTTLFDRASRPPALTDAGRRLAAEARLVLAQARELRHVAGAIREGLEPGLTLVVDPIYPAGALVEACRAFHAEFASVSLRLQTDLLGEARRLVREGDAELGVCILGDAHDRALTALPAGRVQLVPVCAPTHPLANEPAPQRADRLQHHTQLVLTERAGGSEDRGVLAPRTWRVTDLALKVRLLVAGVGWGSAPVDAVADLLERGELVRLRPEPWLGGRHDVALHTIVRADRPLGPAGSWLRQRLVLEPTGDPP